MIGINILAARALQPISRFSQLGTSFTKANQSLAMFEEFSRMPLEKESGSTLTDYAGGLELRDLAFSYPGSKDPLLSHLTWTLSLGTCWLSLVIMEWGKRPSQKYCSDY